MEKAIEHFKSELMKVRTGRATTGLLDGIMVDYYGNPTPLNQVATVSTPDARTIIIQPWEKTILGEIERAIMQSDLGFNPANDGSVIRVPVPALTEERRKELVKLCKKMAEDAKVVLRNARRDGNEQLRKAEKEESLSEDDRKWAEGKVQDLTNTYSKKVDEFLAKKETEIMDV